jgi:hypothetical protein
MDLADSCVRGTQLLLYFRTNYPNRLMFLSRTAFQFHQQNTYQD